MSRFPSVKKLESIYESIVKRARKKPPERRGVLLGDAGLTCMMLYQVSGSPKYLMNAAAHYVSAVGDVLMYGPAGAAVGYTANLLAIAGMLDRDHGDAELLPIALNAAGPVAVAVWPAPAEEWHALLENYEVVHQRICLSPDLRPPEPGGPVGDTPFEFAMAVAGFEALLEEFFAGGGIGLLDQAELLVAAAFAVDRSRLIPFSQLMRAVHNAGVVYQNLDLHRGDRRSLQNGVELLRRHLALDMPGGARAAADDAAVRGEISTLLAMLDLALYEAANDAEALDECIELLVARIADDAHSPRVKERATLGAALRTRYEWNGDPDDLARSAEVMADVSGRGPDRRDLLMLDVHRAMTQAAIAERDRSVAGLVMAAHGYRRVLERVGDDTRTRAIVEGNLASLLRELYLLTGDDAVADHGIAASANAVSLASGDVDRLAKQLSNMGNLLVEVGEARGDTGMLTAGVDACRRAVDVVGTANRFRSRYLANALHALAALYNLTGDEWIVDYAVRTARELVATADESYAGRARYLMLSASWLGRAAQVSGDAAMHDAAVENAEAAVALSLERGDDVAAASMTLGRLIRQWAMTLSPGEERSAQIAKALPALRSGLAATPTDTRQYASRARALATALHESGNGTDEAVPLLRAACRAQAAPLSDRIAAGWGLARLLEAEGRPEEALDAYEAALDLLELLVGPVIARRDGEAVLKQFGELGEEASACALTAGHPVRALLCAERGRAVLLNQTLRLSADVARLEEVAPAVADRFTHAADRLRITGLGLGRGPEVPEAAGFGLADDAARTAVDEFRALVAEIRRLPGFGRFLGGPSESELLAAGSDGPVVVANVASSRSDLIIVHESRVKVVPVPDATHAELGRWSIAVSRTLDDDDGSEAALDKIEAALAECSAWLWEVLCAPLLRELGLAAATDGQDPPVRVWWCLSGFLAYLPVHAAAPAGGADSMLDHVVSSYIPSVGALIAGRRRVRTLSGPGDVVGVSMETTPGFDDLRAAHAEIDAISAVWPGRILELRGPDTTTENVIAALRTHPIAHFACHALMSHTDPFSARLVLTEDDESPLTLWRLIDAGAAETGELAYLSACRTARASIALPTEALHIAAAFYAAGFRHVIGSLWEVEDSVGLAACRAIYTRLAGGEHAGTLDAARAVNSWARAQRRDDPRTMTRYATITHTGI